MKPSDYYETPQWLFNLLNEKYGPLTLDVAASKHNSKCKRFFAEEDNALTRAWEEAWFCNPPYSRIAKDGWIEHALKQPAPGVMLLPARVMSNLAFHEAMRNTREIIVCKGRVSFELCGVPQKACPWPTIALAFLGKK